MGYTYFKPSLFSKAEHLRWDTRQLLFPDLVVAALVAFAEVIWQNIHQISVKSPMRSKWGISNHCIASCTMSVPCHHVISYHSGAWWPHWEGKCHCAQNIPSWKSRGGKVVIMGRQRKQIQLSAQAFQSVGKSTRSEDFSQAENVSQRCRRESPRTQLSLGDIPNCTPYWVFQGSGVSLLS